MKTLQFRYSWWDLIVYSWYYGTVPLLKSKQFCPAVGACCLLNLYLMVRNDIGGATVGTLIIRFAQVVIFWITLVEVLTFAGLVAGGYRKPRVLEVQNGEIYLKARSPEAIPVSAIRTAEKRGPLLVLNTSFTMNRDAQILIPLRCFASDKEREAFLAFLEQEKQETSVQNTANVCEEPREGEVAVSFLMNENRWIQMQTELQNIQRRVLFQGKKNIARWSAAIFLFLAIAAAGTAFREPGGLLVAVIVYFIVFLVVVAVMIGFGKQPVRESAVRNSIKYGMGEQMHPGEFSCRVQADEIDFRGPDRHNQFGWNEVLCLRETERYLLFYKTQIRVGAWIPKAVLQPEQLQQIRGFCELQRAEWKQVTIAPEDMEPKTVSAGKIILLFAGAALLLGGLLVAVLLAAVWNRAKMGSAENPTGADLQAPVRQTLAPEDYETYVPLEKQISVLKSLGFRIPPQMAEEIRTQMEEWPESRVWVEGFPYFELLSYLGMPEYDEETWEIAAYSSQAYWFDWEGADICQDYENILKGIQAQSRGEFTLDQIVLDESGADWETWSGTIAIGFAVNGTPCFYEAALEGDWLDEGILDYIGSCLQAAGAPGRLYEISDNGQGSILFYRDEAWGREFEEKTGITPRSPGFQERQRGLFQ